MLSLAHQKVIVVESKYWVRRKRASLSMARAATSSRARLVHLELAGRYSARAGSDGSMLVEAGLPAASGELPVAPLDRIRDATDAGYYSELETGALFLASQSTDPAQQAEHLRMATIYSGRSRAALHQDRGGGSDDE